MSYAALCAASAVSWPAGSEVTGAAACTVTSGARAGVCARCGLPRMRMPWVCCRGQREALYVRLDLHSNTCACKFRGGHAFLAFLNT